MSTLAVDAIQDTTGNTAMTIDSSGRILTPARPAFRASHGSTDIAGGNIVICTDVTSGGNFNIGGHYSTVTGRFTVPIAGIYQFSITGLYTNNAGTATFKGYWRKNATNQGVAYEYQNSALNNSYDTIGTSTVLINCAVGDLIDLWNETGAGRVHISSLQTKLCGHLIG